ncbi:MAG: hypothetical protein ACKPKO_03615, partial [Candidatus Fonsibacter sp.]
TLERCVHSTRQAKSWYGKNNIATLRAATYRVPQHTAFAHVLAVDAQDRFAVKILLQPLHDILKSW